MASPKARSGEWKVAQQIVDLFDPNADQNIVGQVVRPIAEIRDRETKSVVLGFENLAADLYNRGYARAAIIMLAKVFELRDEHLPDDVELYLDSLVRQITGVAPIETLQPREEPRRYRTHEQTIVQHRTRRY